MTSQYELYTLRRSASPRFQRTVALDDSDFQAQVGTDLLLLPKPECRSDALHPGERISESRVWIFDVDPAPTGRGSISRDGEMVAETCETPYQTYSFEQECGALHFPIQTWINIWLFGFAWHDLVDTVPGRRCRHVSDRFKDQVPVSGTIPIGFTLRRDQRRRLHSAWASA